MTQKEKEFVCFLLGKLQRKKEHMNPDFYTHSGIPALLSGSIGVSGVSAPVDSVGLVSSVSSVGLHKQDASDASVLQKREATASTSLKREATTLTADCKINKDEEKTTTTQMSNHSQTNPTQPNPNTPQPSTHLDPSNIVKKKITSRSVIESIYDILYANSLFQDNPNPPIPREDAERISEHLKVVGEELFSREKGAKLVKLLLDGVEYQEEESVSKIQNTLICVLFHRIKYIPYNSSLASLLADMLPVFSKKADVLVEKNNVKIISGTATYSTAGVVLAHIVLVVLQHKKKKQHPEMCRSIFQTLDVPTVKRAFDKIAPQHLWKLFAAIIRDLSTEEAESLRRILGEEVKKGLNCKSACVIDSIHEFTNSKPASENKRV